MIRSGLSLCLALAALPVALPVTFPFTLPASTVPMEHHASLSIGADDAVALTPVRLGGLQGPVDISMDGFGVPTVEAESLADAIRAQGFLHGRDRFFQMDSFRRLAAGELSELIGRPGIDQDRHYRRYRFRHIAAQVYARMDEETRALLRDYARAVNTGLASRGRLPVEYTTLFARPAPWQPEDSVLVMLMMFDMLQVEQQYEDMLGVMHAALPVELVDFLTPVTGRWDAPLVLADGDEANGRTDYRPAAVPGADVIDLRNTVRHDDGDPAAESDFALGNDDPTDWFVPGSNNWAVAGSQTVHGEAIVANDPHLFLTAPGIWYRMHLRWAEREAIGLTMPGLPGVIIGSTDRIAWGYTNFSGDFQDLILIEEVQDHPGHYRTPDGPEPFGEVVETIHVRGQEPVEVKLHTTRWGVVTHTDHRGRPMVLRWTALDPACVDFSLVWMLEVETLEEAVAGFAAAGMPSQNVMLADDSGRIAWVLSGAFPRRAGFTGRHPVSWAEPGVGWDGYLTPEEKPHLIDPPSGMLFSANNRTIPAAMTATHGGIWSSGSRATRIASELRSMEAIDEAAMHALQLDTTVLPLMMLRDLAVDTAADLPRDIPHLAEVIGLLRDWNGRADHEATVIGLLNAFRAQLIAHVIDPLVQPCREIVPDFRLSWRMVNEPLARLLEERPAHLLNPRFDSWEALMAACLAAAIRAELGPGQDLQRLSRPWGERNLSRIQHPLSMAISTLGDQLNMSEAPQPGHPNAIRVAGASFGASARMVVSPPRLDEAILTTPTGQSGDPASPHYRDLHESWLAGLAVPMMPNDPVRRIELRPPSPRE